MLEAIIFIGMAFQLPAAVIITYLVGHNHAALRKAGCAYIGRYEGALGARSTSDARRTDWAVL